MTLNDRARFLFVVRVFRVATIALSEFRDHLGASEGNLKRMQIHLRDLIKPTESEDSDLAKDKNIFISVDARLTSRILDSERIRLEIEDMLKFSHII